MATLLALGVACGGPDAAGPGDPSAEQGAVITFGSTAVLYQSGQDNLRLMQNFLRYLGANRAAPAELRILYTLNCDPRTTPDNCRLAADFATLAPFFDMMAAVGTIEFGLMTAAAGDDYDVVIADFCHGLRSDASRSLLRSYLAAGGRALVLADNFCFVDPSTTTSSAMVANTVVGSLGVTFTRLDPPESDALLIPESARVGLLQGVASVDVYRVTPQDIGAPFEPVLTSAEGVLSAVAQLESGVWYAAPRGALAQGG